MSDSQSRRDLLVGGAALAAGLAVATATRDANAQTADVGALNTLLTAEWKAISAYNAALGTLNTPSSGDPAIAIAPAAAAIATHFRNQHQDHAAALTSLISSPSLMGTPVSQLSVVFTPPSTAAPTNFQNSVTDWLKLAANLEQSAAVSYTNALSALTVATNAKVVAAIGGVETQHFIVLYLLLNQLVTPGAMVSMPAVANTLVPDSFVVAVGSGTVGLDTLTPLAYQS